MSRKRGRMGHTARTAGNAGGKTDALARRAPLRMVGGGTAAGSVGTMESADSRRLSALLAEANARSSSGPASYTNTALALQRQEQAHGIGQPGVTITPGRQYPPMPAISKKTPLLEAMGAPGTAILQGIIYNEDYNPDFFWRDAVEIYDQMIRNDGQIMAIVQMMELPIRRANWTIEPASQDARDIEIASFVESCLFHDLRYQTQDGRTLSQKWDDILRHALMMLRYGFSGFEKVWREEDGWIKLARLTPLLPISFYRWWVGADNELVGIQQYTFKDYTYQFIDIPADKLLLFHHRMEGANYQGYSLLRSVYKHWYYKDQFYKIDAVGLERNAIAVPYIKLPASANQSDVQAANAILANLRANESMGATIPFDWEIGYLPGSEHYAAHALKSIEHHDVMIARGVLAQFLNLGSTETGAYALATAQIETFLQNLQAEAAYLEDVFNGDLVRQLVDFNYDGVAVYPRVKCARLANADINDVVEAIAKLKAKDASFLTADPQMEDWIRDQYGMPAAPKSPVVNTNPTAPSEPGRPETQPDAHGDAQSRNAGQTDATANAGAAVTEDASGDATNAGDSGDVASLRDQAEATDLRDVMAETVSEGRYLREALRAVYADDAVGRGLAHEERQVDRAARAASELPDGAVSAPALPFEAGAVALFNPNHDSHSGQFASGGAVGAGGGSAKGGKGTAAGKGGRLTKTQKAAQVATQSVQTRARARGYNIPPVGRIGLSREEEEQAAKARLATANKRLTAREREFKAAEKQSAEMQAANRDAIAQAHEERQAAYVADFNAHSVAKDAIAEARAEAKGQSGTAPKTYEKMQASRQPYADAKARYAEARAKADISGPKADRLLARYHDPSKPLDLNRMLKDHPDLKAALREKWKDDSAASKAQSAMWRKQGVYEGARDRLAGKVSDAEIAAHPAWVAAKARLDAADAQLMGLTGEHEVRAAFEARAKAQAELTNARDALAHPTWKYPITGSRPTHAATYTNPESWPQAKLDAAARMEAAGRQRIANGEEERHVGDLALHELQHEQGFDGAPDIVSEANLALGIAHGDIEVWRGDTKESHTDNMMLGNYHTGLGVRGNGTYGQEGANGHAVARSYATNHGNSVDNGRIMHMAIKADAKIVNYDDLQREARAAALRFQEQLAAARAHGDRRGARRASRLSWLASNDSSRFAVARGYDAIRIPTYGQVILLNRTALQISHEVRSGNYTGG